jgi:predicted metal-dependent phosphoesterase TrpH
VDIVNPYENLSGGWLKGGLHLHSTRSDGADVPSEVLRDHARLGYQFLALTDHNVSATREDLKDAHGLVAIPGNEYRPSKQDPETGVIGVTGELLHDVELCAGLQDARQKAGFLIYNHPNWHFDHWPTKEMLRCKAAHAIEIYNAVVEILQAPAEATDKWDRLLTAGYRIWGVAADDAHTPEHRNKAWVMVNSDPNEAAILEALRQGRFYATTGGVTIEEIRLEDGTLHVRAPGAKLIRFIAERGTVRKMVKAEEASYQVQEKDVYVRVECWGCGLDRAWLNPVFVEGEVSQTLSDRFRNWYLKGPMT